MPKAEDFASYIYIIFAIQISDELFELLLLAPSKACDAMEGRYNDDVADLVTGGEQNLVYCRQLGHGGYGTVHKVLKIQVKLPFRC